MPPACARSAPSKPPCLGLPQDADGHTAFRASRSPKSFFLAVLDGDRGEFSVEGPMADDRPWNHAVVLAQRAGRRVRCLVEADRDRIIADMKALYSWRLVRAGSIVRPAED